MSEAPPSIAPPSGHPAPRAGGARPVIRLRVQVGVNMGQTYTMSGDVLRIGRSPDNDLVLDDPRVSRYHAQLSHRGDVLIVEDLGSTNGTLVNGRRISGPHVLQPTETIAIGSSVFSVEGFSAPVTVSLPPMGGVSAPGSTGASSASEESFDKPIPRVTSPTPWLVGGSILGLLVVIAVIAILLNLSSAFTPKPTPSLVSPPYVSIQFPVSGSQLRANQPITVKAIATDSIGVTRVELWVKAASSASSIRVDEQRSDAPQGEQRFEATLKWVPAATGSYALEVRAYNSQNVASEVTVVYVQVI